MSRKNKNHGKDLHIKFYHPDIDILSDRTFRSLIKSFSQVCRSILVEEIDYLINEGNYDYGYSQSLKDRVKNEIPACPVYYVENVSKGSLELNVLVSGAIVILLTNTLGEDIKKAWDKTQISQEFQELLVTRLNRVQLYMFDRNEYLKDKINRNYLKEVIGGRFIVDSIEFINEKNKETVLLTIKTIKGVDRTINKEIVNNNAVIEHIDKLISRLEKYKDE